MLHPIARLLIGVITLLSILTTSRADDPPLVKLAEIGPWSSVSSLIGFGDRLWFANSVKYVNHNSADLYSYDPTRGDTRFERHLFSQDAGDPAVLGGRLYWPLEDARASAGVGEFMATDGASWDWRTIPGVLAFHAQAFFAEDGSLYAGLSAWQAAIARSDDGGVTWRAIYRHPTPEEQVSRITTFAALNGRLFAGVTAERETAPKLLIQTTDGFAPVAGWPERGATIALASFNGWIYGAHWSRDEVSSWRTDGARVERVAALDGANVRSFAVSRGTLYVAIDVDRAGRVMASEDGVNWRLVHEFDDVHPIALATLEDRLYVGTEGPGEHGALWGPPPDASRAHSDPPRLSPLTQPPDFFASDDDAVAALQAFEQRLLKPDSFGHHFSVLVEPFARSHLAVIGPWLQGLLSANFPEGEIAMFGGNVKIAPRDIGRWYILRAMGLNGHGRVPPALIAEPLRAPPNQAEKYFDIAPLAVWVASALHQDDPATIAALIDRLSVPGEPLWFTGDIVGALQALTGQRFGYDIGAWKVWWAETATTTSNTD